MQTRVPLFSSSGKPACTLSIVMPVLNEASMIEMAVARARAECDECIVVDGGSADATVSLAQGAGARVVQSERGRALQMNAGARQASSHALLFLHADCQLPIGAGALVREQIARGAVWGRFDVNLSERRFSLSVVGRMMNLRSRLTGIATGDQGIFVSRLAFDEQGGYAAIALMEDIEFSQRMRRVARPVCLRAKMQVSARRWEHRGVARTVVQMWFLRAAYYFGASPDWLHRQYYGRR